MINAETDIKLKNMWESMPHIEKLNLLSENNFWEGLSVYRYEYIPEDLKYFLMRQMQINEANQP